MRWVGWLLFSLTAVGWVACELPTAATSSDSSEAKGQPPAVHWRRTQHGWEPAEDWQPPVDSYAPTLHPATVAALIALLSVLALSALPGSTRSAERERRKKIGPDAARISAVDATN